MKLLYILIILQAITFNLIAQNPTRKMIYPVSKKDHTTDTYFGTKVEDPYRWLETDVADDTKAWVTEQNKVTQKYLAQIPYRDKIKQRLEKLWNYEKYSAPFKEGEYIYFYKNDGLQNQSVLYRQKEGKEPEVFLDPNTFSKDGTTSLAGIEFTKDGSLAAYQLSEGGSDWRKVIVLKTADKSIVGDTLLDVKFSGLTWKGNEGFYYSSYDKPLAGSQLSGLTQYHKLYYHKLGTPQNQDVLVFGGEATARRYIGASITEDGRYLSITAANSTTGNELYLQDLSNAGPIVNVVNNFDSESYVLDSEGTKLLIFTNLNAPNNKVITVDASKPGPENWKNLIEETENVLNAGTAGNKLFANYLKDATSLVMQYSMEGKLERTINLPGVGTAAGFGGKKHEKELYYSFTSYVYPTTIFKYDIGSGRSELYKKSGVQFNPELFESKQVFFTSKDGT
ncbi:MAG: S9 family peptidase, partial [Pyrinomonadaceae bacterium]|nr:S9 family peptidase [Sphingobacteriaceae bacterium]